MQTTFAHVFIISHILTLQPTFSLYQAIQHLLLTVYITRYFRWFGETPERCSKLTLKGNGMEMSNPYRKYRASVLDSTHMAAVLLRLGQWSL